MTPKGGDFRAVCKKIFGNGCQFRATIEGFREVGHFRTICKEILGNFCQSIATIEGFGEVGNIILEGDINFVEGPSVDGNWSTFHAGLDIFFTIEDDGFT